MARLRTAERRTQIIDKAIKIIHTQGFAGLAIRELAKQVGISEPAIYRHFANKDEIILGILDRVQQMGDTLATRLSGTASGKEKIRQFILFHFDFLTQNREITSVVFSENIFEPNSILKARLRAILTSRYQILRALLDEARQERNLVDLDPDDLAVLIIGNIRVIVLEWRLSDFEFDLRERGNRALQTIAQLIFT